MVAFVLNSASRKFIQAAELQLMIERHFLYIDTTFLSSTTTAMIFCRVKSSFRLYIHMCTTVSIYKTKEFGILYDKAIYPSLSWILRLFTVPKGFHPCSPSQFSLIWNLNRIPWLRHSRNRGYLVNWRIYLRDLA